MGSRFARRLTPLGVAAICAAGCGDLYSDPSTTVSSVQADPLPPSGRLVDASVTVPQDFLSSCPTRASEGEGCDAPGLTCEYGSSPDMHCNTTLACLPDGSQGSGTWTARPSVLCPSYACPSAASSLDGIDGTPCSLPATDAAPPSNADELVCPMIDGVCACTTGVDAAHAHARRWVCVKPDAGCSPNRPLAGEYCSMQRACDYGSCLFKRGLRMECDGAAWRTEGALCN